MTLADLRLELKSRFSEFIADTRVDRLLNDAYHELLERGDWFFNETDATGAAPLTIADVGQVLSVTDTTNGALLWGEDRGVVLEYAAGDLTTTGLPHWWYFSAPTVVSVWPVQVVNLAVHYLKVPVDLSAAGDVPILPTRYHLLIVDAAQIHALAEGPNPTVPALIEGHLARLNALTSNFEAKVQRMLGQMEDRNLGNPEQTIVRGGS